MLIPILARALLAMAITQECVCAQNQMTVAVFNRSDAPPRVIASAVQTAQNAFLNIRVRVRWIICGPETCPQEAVGGSYVELFVVPRLRSRLTYQVDSHPAGYAMSGGFAHPRAYALYGTANMVAERTMREVDLVLGCIFIHEVGHLLGLTHQPHGAMRANLEPADMDKIARGRAFNLEEGIKLRAALNGASVAKNDLDIE
jgi:Putative peptidase family